MRDHAEEAKLLEEGAELCLRVYGQQAPAFARHVMERLALGKATYGDFAFLHRDNLGPQGAEPEGQDGAGYPILEFEKLAVGFGETERAELRQATLGVIAAAVNYDAALRRLIATRNDLLT